MDYERIKPAQTRFIIGKDNRFIVGPDVPIHIDPETLAENLEKMYGITFEKLPDSAYPGMSLIKLFDLIKQRADIKFKYTKGSIFRLLRESKEDLPHLKIGGQIFLTPEGVDNLIKMEQKSYELHSKAGYRRLGPRRNK